MLLNKNLDSKLFFISQFIILAVGLVVTGGIYYILNIQYKTEEKPFLNGPITTAPRSLLLDLKEPDDNLMTNTSSILVSGKTGPSKEVLISTNSDSIGANSRDLVIKSKADGNFSTDVILDEGVNRKGYFDKIGGSAYLTSLINIVPTSAHIEHYAKIIKDHAIRRNLISETTRLIEKAYDEGGSVEELLEGAESAIFALSQEHVSRDFLPIKDALTESFDRLDELQKSSGKLRGVPTGFRDLDSKLAGMQNSNLIILASRPGQGKTSMAINIAQHVAVNAGMPVGIFSLEMSQEELVDRLLVGQADIDAWKLKTGKLDEKDFDRLSLAMGELAEAPLFIDDTPGISISEMRTKARRLQIEHGLKFLIVDYLQLIKGRNLENRVQEVSEISQNLKNLARELKIPVLAISQLSRAVESRGSKRPQLADLRESGAIEQDADVVMFIYREDPEKMEQVTLDIQKHRNGPVGEIQLVFRSERTKFYGLEKSRKPATATAAA